MFSFVSTFINYVNSNEESNTNSNPTEPYVITTDTKHTIHMISFLSSPLLLENIIELNYQQIKKCVLQSCHYSLSKSKKQCSVDFYRSSFIVNGQNQTNYAQFFLDIQQQVSSEHLLTIISFCSQTILTILIDKLFSSLPNNLYIGECSGHHCKTNKSSNRLTFSLDTQHKQELITISKLLRVFSVSSQYDAQTQYKLQFTIQIDCNKETIFCTILKITS